MRFLKVVTTLSKIPIFPIIGIIVIFLGVNNNKNYLTLVGIFLVLFGFILLIFAIVKETSQKRLFSNEDKKTSEKVAALNALSKLGDENLTKDIIPILKDSNPVVRIAAINALSTLGDKSAIVHIINILKGKKGNKRKKNLI